jgi:hypothetical protein
METAPEFVDQNETENAEPQIEQYDKTISGAANLLNYGLDGLAREIGVEQTMQAIKNYDPSNSLDNPIKGLYESAGIKTKIEFEGVRDTNIANRDSVNEYRDSINAPSNFERNTEHALKALSDAKELITAVESSPEYSSLRNNAKAAEMGYFKFATHDIPQAGLADLFSRLTDMKDKDEQDINAVANSDEASENSDEIAEDTAEEDKDVNEISNTQEPLGTTETPNQIELNQSESSKDPSIIQPEIPAEEELHNQQI